MAREVGCEIVPIAVEQYDKTFYFNIGSNYKIPGNTTKTEKELNLELRDKLCSLKWEIMESVPMLKRDEIKDFTLNDFQKEIVERCNYGYGFSLEDALSEKFHDKNIVSEEEVFNFVKKIKR